MKLEVGQVWKDSEGQLYLVEGVGPTRCCGRVISRPNLRFSYDKSNFLSVMKRFLAYNSPLYKVINK